MYQESHTRINQLLIVVVEAIARPFFQNYSVMLKGPNKGTV